MTISVLIILPALLALYLGFLIGKRFPVEGQLPIFINGLPPGKDGGKGEDNDGSKVTVFDLEKERGAPDYQIFSRYSDTKGEAHGFLPASFSGKRVKISIIDPAYQLIDTVQEVSLQGLNYTARMEKDRNFLGAPSNPKVHGKWNTEAEYAKAQKTMHQRLVNIGDALGKIPPAVWGLAYLGIIILFAVLYTINLDGLKVNFDNNNLLFSFLHMLYFSVVTITTLGYGDIVPKPGLNQFFVGLESISGIIILGLFINSVIRRGL